MKARHLLLPGLLAGFLAASCSTYEPDSVLENSRVKIVLEQNTVKPQWDSGDKVAAFAMSATHPLSSYIFHAADKGTSVEFSCPTEVVDATKYHFVYPASPNLSLEADGIHAIVPVSQTAVERGVAPELFYSTGTVSSLSQTVQMSPASAFVSFTLLGGAAEEVVRATVSGPVFLSGDILIREGEALQSYFRDIPADASNPANYVELSGRFVSGGTYYAAVIPGATDVPLQVSVEDASGTVRTVQCGNVSLRAGEIADLGTVYVGPSLSGENDIFPIMTASKGVKPIVLMFVPDGWVNGNGVNSREEYVKACREGASYLFNVEPFKSHKEYFTVYVSWKAASEPGVGTTFGTQIGVWYNNYLGLTTEVRDGICEFAQGICPEILDGTIKPAELGIFLLVNGRQNYGAVCEWIESDPQYEGRFVALVDYTADYQYGSLPLGVTPAQWGGVTSDGPMEARTDENGNTYTYMLTEDDFRELGYVNYSGSNWGYLETWRNTLLHEGMGHGFGRLQDEYWFSTKKYPYSTINGQNKVPRQAMNLSVSSTVTPWNNLLSLRDELIEKDPRYERIGLFQGGLAEYFSGIWRPERTSAMNDMRPYFGTWDRALIYERIMQLSGERPDFDVVNSMEDLRTFLEQDLANNGNYDPLRD